MSMRIPAGHRRSHLSLVPSVAVSPEDRDALARLAVELAAVEARILAVQEGRREAKRLLVAIRQVRPARARRIGRDLVRLDHALALARRERRRLLRGEPVPRTGTCRPLPDSAPAEGTRPPRSLNRRGSDRGRAPAGWTARMAA
jgi:hypothetical protein